MLAIRNVNHNRSADVFKLPGRFQVHRLIQVIRRRWGLNGLTYSVAEELRVHDIRVSVLRPGSVETELSPHAGKDPAKMLQPEGVAHAVEMLVTQEARSFVSEILIRPTQKP